MLVLNMNTKGSISDLLESYFAYFVIFALFFALVLGFILQFKHGAALQEQYYAFALAELINHAQAGDELVLDAQAMSALAYTNGITNFNEIVQVDNQQHEIIVHLQRGKSTRYPFYAAVSVDDIGIAFNLEKQMLYLKLGGAHE